MKMRIIIKTLGLPNQDFKTANPLGLKPSVHIPDVERRVTSLGWQLIGGWFGPLPASTEAICW